MTLRTATELKAALRALELRAPPVATQAPATAEKRADAPVRKPTPDDTPAPPRRPRRKAAR